MKSVVNAGELKEFVEIQTRGEVINDEGFLVEGFSTIVKTRCKGKTVSTKEFFSQGATDSKLTYKIIVRRRRDFDINNDHYILYRGKRFNIKNVHELDDFYFEITIEELS
jgi:SPP1 family predicted phage head-tail adaptor